MSFSDPNYYDYLQVSHNAEPEVIEGAYKKLMQKYHPDVNPDVDPVKVKNINAAHDVLSDPAMRRAYDEWLNTQNAQNAQRGSTGASAPAPEDSAARKEKHDKIILELKARQSKQKMKDLLGALIATALIVAVAAFMLSVASKMQKSSNAFEAQTKANEESKAAWASEWQDWSSRSEFDDSVWSEIYEQWSNH